MRAAVVAVGSELLLGDVVNSNAADIGRQLRSCGVQVVTSVAVADDLERLATTIELCLAEVDLVVLCGGLGPTVDDLTREAMALACHAPLSRDAAVEADLRERFAARLPTFPPEVLRQADVPDGAQVLANPVGSAPGLWWERDSKVVVALPGPPRELTAVAEPVWRRLAERTGRVLTTRQVLCAGLGESAVAALLRDVVVPDGVALSYLAGAALVRVRFTGLDAGALAGLVEQVDGLLSDHVFGHDDQTLDGVVHELLGTRGQTVGVAESLTGGLLAAALTNRPGASATFRGSLVAYATDLKESLVGVPGPLLSSHGAVSAETAAALAAGARDRLGADWGLAVTGVAGPTEQDDQPVGTVYLAVAGPHGPAAGPPQGQVLRVHLPGGRQRVREVSVTHALDLLRRHLSGKVVGTS